MSSPTFPPASLKLDAEAAPGPAPARKPAHEASPGPRRLRSETLLADRREVEIEHAGQVYRLRLTSLGKLILTK